jgi:hypothetical protein
MKYLHKFLMLGLAAGLISGCDEESNNTDTPENPACDVSMNTCSGTVAHFCGVNGMLQIDCGLRGQICVDAACQPDPNACTSKDNSCTNGKLSICSNGKIETTVCAADEKCGVDDFGTPACVKKPETKPACTSADNTCTNGKLRVCTDGRLLLHACAANEECGFVDGIAACVRKGDAGACTEADNKCENGILSICQDGEFKALACEANQVCGVDEAGNPACVKNVVPPPETQWIGNACQCEGEGCAVLGIPLPVPQGNGTIVGCENVDITEAEGGVVACLQTIPKSQAMTAPPTYFPQGYCAISAVGCENSSMCSFVAYGDAENMNSCPHGSTLVASVFNYSIVGTPAKITNKTCVKTCQTDADCNTAGEMTCIEKQGARFCYNVKNFEFMGDNITVTPF